MKKNNIILAITTVLCLLPLILSAAVYVELPDQVAIHFDVSGTPDNYVPKALAAFGLPVLMAVVNLFSCFMRKNDPKSANQSNKLNSLITWIIPLVSVVLVPITLFMAMGVDFPIQIVIPAIVGVIIVVCGNYLPKSKQNYTIGIKLPWTLSSEQNWNKTHRFAGYLWVIGGIALVIISFLKSNLIPMSIAIIVVIVVAPMIYSYVIYKKDTVDNN